MDPVKDSTTDAVSLLEQFTKLSMLQRAHWVYQVLNEDQFTQTELAARLKTSRRQVARYYKLATAPPEIQSDVDLGKLPLTVMDGTAGMPVMNALSDLEAVVDQTASAVPEKTAAESAEPQLPDLFTRGSEKVLDDGAFDELYAKYRAAMGYHKVPETADPGPLPEICRIVVVNDLHIPEHCNEMVQELIEREAATADLLFIAGDFLDLFNWSVFPKHSKKYSALEELQIGQAVLTLLAEKFRRVQ